MANNETLIPIPGRLHSVATEGHVAGANEIYDDAQAKDQETINSELIQAVGTGGSVDSRITAAKAEIIGNATSACDTLGEAESLISAEVTRAEAAEEALDGRVDTLEEAVGSGGSVDERIEEAVAPKANSADVYAKTETYNKTELNNLITTPNQQYVNVTANSQTTAVTDVLPATGAADTTYRVGNWDGTQYNDSVFSEYAWNGSTYIKLSTKSQVGEVYDISANHADTKYADLAAALNGGANIPQSLRKGGMSVKFVQSSDNKYVQWRLTATSFTTDTTKWVAENEDFRNEVMQEVNEAIESITPIEITGDVTNAPDEEDLTSVNVGGTDVLKFKDKAYNPLTYSGMGRKILRKNIVNGINTLTQSMIDKENTIYVIQYDFTLGEDITVPAGCVLEFDGGSISGAYTITGQDTGIEAGLVKIFDTDVTFSGTWGNDLFYVDWFGINDFNLIIAKIISTTCFNKYKFNKDSYVSSSDGEYTIANSVQLIGSYSTTINIGHQIQIIQTAANLTIEDITFNFTVVNTSPLIHSIGGYGTSLNRCGWNNGGTFVKMGTKSTNSYNLRVFKARSLILANAGKPLFELTHGAGFYMNDFNEVHHIEATTPSEGQTMNTVPGTDFLLVNGIWDTAMICVFIEKLYNGITIKSPDSNRIALVNANIHDSIFDYVRNAAVSIRGISSFQGSFVNNHVYAWEGIGFDAKGYPAASGETNAVILYATKIIGNKFQRSGEESINISTGSSPSYDVLIANNMLEYDNSNYVDKSDKCALKVFLNRNFTIVGNTTGTDSDSNVGTRRFVVERDRNSYLASNSVHYLSYSEEGGGATPYIKNNYISSIKTSGTFNERPLKLTLAAKGFEYYDETSKRVIYWDGTMYRNAVGEEIPVPFVDLGLSSGILWSKYNIDLTQIDKFASAKEERGSQFSWGNVDGHNPVNDTYQDVYNWGTGVSTEPYVSSDGHDVEDSVLPIANDAACVNIGENWRVPTLKQFVELNNGCTWEYTTINGIGGWLGTSRSNGNTIFFPVTGYGYSQSLNSSDIGYYWMASNKSEERAGQAMFTAGYKTFDTDALKYQGCSIRPILLV